MHTALGSIGGLICWENRMPLARYAMYQGGPQIWVAPTADEGALLEPVGESASVEGRTPEPSS